MCLALMLAIAIVEGGVRAAFFMRGQLPPCGDPSLELEWQWAQNHLQAGTAVLPGEFDFDPTLGWRLRPGTHGFGVTTNQEGIRDEREIARTPAQGELRVALVGDSFTFGDGNADHETFGWILQSSLGARATVLNFGVPSYGTDQALLMYEERARHFGPRVVVLGFFLQDYQRNLLSFRDYAKPCFVPEGDGLKLTNVPVIAPEELYSQYVSQARRLGGGPSLFTAGLIERGVSRASLGWIREGAPGFVVLSRIMERFQKDVRDSGAEPVFLVLANDSAIYEPGSRWARLEDLALERSRALGMRTLTVTPALRAFAKESPGTPLFQVRTVHYTKAANEIVARELGRALTEWGLVPR